MGNFADMKEDRVVSREEAVSLMKELGFHHYIETSAYTGENITTLFETVTKHLFKVHELEIANFVSNLNQS